MTYFHLQHFIGGLAVAVAAICTGSYQVPRKLEPVEKLHPPLEDTIYVFYLCCGFVASCLMGCVLLPYNRKIMNTSIVRNDFAFTWWGALSGALITLAFHAGFFAIARLGLAVHAGISMGVAVVTSFLWGVLVNGDHLVYPAVNFFSVFLLIFGSCLAALHVEISGFIRKLCKPDSLNAEQLSSVSVNAAVPEASPLIHVHEKQTKQEVKRRCLGILSSIVCGSCGGLSLGPMSFIPPEDKGIAFLPSFATGIAIMAATATVTRLAVRRELPEWHFKSSFAYGLCSGFLYFIATVAIIVAIPRVSFAVAYPCKQCAVVVGGLWGIFFFKEIKGFSAAAFWLGSACILTGAILLSNFTFPMKSGISEAHHPP